MEDPNALWAKVVKAIHRDEYGPVRMLPKFGGLSHWVNIARSMEKLKQKGVNLADHVSRKVGDGSSTRFWHDVWLVEEPLKVRYSRLFALESDSDAKVVDRNTWSKLLMAFGRHLRSGIQMAQ